jgi:hypothetical protein
MKKVCSLLLLFTLFMPITLKAEIKYIGVGDNSYAINTETLEASVRGTAMGEYDRRDSQHNNIRQETL